MDITSGINFSVCHATARLPHGWEHSHRQWVANAECPFEYLLGIHERDRHDVPQDDGSVLLAVNSNRYCSVDNWNCAAKASSGRVIILNADDFFPPPSWDRKLLEVIPDLNSEYIIHVSTGCPDQAWEDRLISLGIISRALYERWGYALYPEYESMESDVDFTERGYRENVVIEARHLLFEHRHPVFGKADYDAVYRWQNRPEAYASGKTILLRRRAEGFAR